MEVFEDAVDKNENVFEELISSLKSNKQLLRKYLKAEEAADISKNGADDSEIPLKKKRVDNELEDDDDDEEDSEDEDSDLEEEESESSDSDEFSDTDDSDESDNEKDEKPNQTLYADPFKTHFEQDLEETVVEEIEKAKYEKGKKKDLSKLIACEEYNYPDGITSQLEDFLVNIKRKHENEKELFQEASIKGTLESNWKHVERSKKVFSNEVHNHLMRSIVSYKDVFHLNATYEYWDKIRHLYVLHVVNHVLKSRTKVMKNNGKINQAQKENKEIPDLRDQGLTRPKVLILVPFRNFCLEIVKDIIKLLFAPGSKSQIMQKKRFMQEFSPDPNEKESKMERSDDFKSMFRGNIDDCFRVGMSISKNTLKLFTDFYSADIIIASPLGLRTIIGSEGEKQDFDFLSSIEMLIMDQADAFLMQNWEHVSHIFEYLNLIPKQSHNTDFSRVRMSAVNGWSRYYRQTILFSSLQSPEFNGLFNRNCVNFNGKIKYMSNDMNGSVAHVVSQIPQLYQRIDCTSFVEDADKRFDFFTRSVLPEFKNEINKGTAIFIPSYYDFVRIRNYFKKENLGFVQISEYSKRSNISKARSLFSEQKRHFLLFSERFQFFYRYRLKGIKHIIFYQLPHYPNYYSELLNFMDRTPSATCNVLFSRFDGFKLEAVVGIDRCKKMVSSVKDSHMIVANS